MEGEIWKRRVPAPGVEVWNLSVKGRRGGSGVAAFPGTGGGFDGALNTAKRADEGRLWLCQF
jgi:hypothetical protein